MSNSPKFTPVPAYEMLQSIHRPELAEQLFESMTLEEQQTTCRIMDLCRARKKAMEFESSNDILHQVLPRSLVEKNILITVKVGECLRYLGYVPQNISGPTSGETAPVGVINW